MTSSPLSIRIACGPKACSNNGRAGCAGQRQDPVQPSGPVAGVPRDEAVSAAARTLLEVRERHGPQAVAFVAGFTKEARPYLQRLAHCFGSPHYLTESSCCFGSCFVAAAVTLGKEYDYFLGPSRTRYSNTKCRLVWSTNPTESRLPYDRHHLITDASEVATIVVDPRRTPLAEAARIHLQPRPGTDGALALGMAQVIFEEGLEERSSSGVTPMAWTPIGGM